MKDIKFAQIISEFIGTYFLVFFGCGAVILSETQGAALNLSPSIIFGATVATMIYSLGHISGAHFNPAVSFAFFVTKQISGIKALIFSISQTLGAFLASLSHLLIFEREHSFGAASSELSPSGGFMIELLLSFALMFVIFSVATDSRAVGHLAGIAIGLVILVCAEVGGPLTGAAMNPARFLGPALVSGKLSFSWLYIIGSITGASLGAMTYVMIKCNSENPETETNQGCC